MGGPSPSSTSKIPPTSNGGDAGAKYVVKSTNVFTTMEKVETLLKEARFRRLARLSGSPSKPSAISVEALMLAVHTSEGSALSPPPSPASPPESSPAAETAGWPWPGCAAVVPGVATQTPEAGTTVAAPLTPRSLRSTQTMGRGSEHPVAGRALHGLSHHASACSSLLPQLLTCGGDTDLLKSSRIPWDTCQSQGHYRGCQVQGTCGSLSSEKAFWGDAVHAKGGDSVVVLEELTPSWGRGNYNFVSSFLLLVTVEQLGSNQSSHRRQQQRLE
ncbi:hypothetical protein TREES_T100016007 [Tupaia chinensis]|uniref:Uncharacterized protein n=1 Tax=Tupaia chinensis TaxID=246437 RepID=L9KQJ3_TUPCH|nr:hypothetical protein TREES_T100016007 [Tupaia chinensis]